MTKIALKIIDQYLSNDFRDGANEKELISDRLLVSAAPDMLEALIEVHQMLECGENNLETHEVVLNAIQKATWG